MKKQTIIKKIRELTEKGNEVWNHQYDFGEGIKTRSSNIKSPGRDRDWEK